MLFENPWFWTGVGYLMYGLVYGVKDSRLYLKKLKKYVPAKRVSFVTLIIISLLITILWPIIVWVIVRGQNQERKENIPTLGMYFKRKHRLERLEKYVAEEKHREAEKRERLRRAEERKKWFMGNPPKLYYRTIDGITSVLTPSEYEAITRRTDDMRLDDIWKHSDLLYPAQHTYIFVTKGAEDRIRNIDGDIFRYKVTGRYSSFHRFCEDNKVEMVEKTDIFVPWLTEAFLPFGEQFRLISDNFVGPDKITMIEKQAPKEFWSLDW